MSAAYPDTAAPLDQARAWLESLSPRGIQLGLARVEEALARMGNPERGLKVVTVAGTNGKGSTAAMIASIIHSAGYRVGLYTSPHLVSVTERITIGGNRILPHDFTRWTERVREVIEPADGDVVPLTYFEALTVMAVGYFAEREVDVAVLEVGLGGRLDATSAVPPIATVITTIGLDHQALLGNDLASICREKAGIMKPGVDLVTAVEPELFREVLGPRALELRCPIRRLDYDFEYRWLPEGFRYRGWQRTVGPVRLGLRGVHQGLNAALACATAETLTQQGLHIKAAHLADGLLRARHPGRLERRPASGDTWGEHWPALLIDAAHNPHGATALARHIAAFLPERPRIMVFGVNPDKDVVEMLRILGPKVDGVVLTGSAARPIPAWEPYVATAARYCDNVAHEPDPGRALDLARSLAGPDGGMLLCGSIYMLGDVWPLLPERRFVAP